MAVAVILVSFAMAAAAAAYAIYMGQKNNKSDMKQTDDYKPTMASEGSVVSLVYGRVRVPGNIIWWGNLVTEKVYASGGGGGKSFGSKKQATGFNYYADCWQAICIGKASLVKTYVNDKESEVPCYQQNFNDGTGIYYPVGITYATKLTGVAHIFFQRMFLGENTKQFPTIHFVVDRVLDGPILYQNMASGNNPAAVIYDILIQGGISSNWINATSFNEAATYWYNKGYGINLVIDGQQNVFEAIEIVLNYTPGMLYKDQDGKYALRAVDPYQSYSYEIDDKNIMDFTFNRKTWSQTLNDFHATYVSENDAFTERVVIAQNPAAIRLAVQKNTQSIDLKCFRDSIPASDRLWEILKHDSYPSAQIKFKTSLRFSTVYPGEVIRVSKEDYGLAGVDFRVLEVSAVEWDKNDVEITAEQCTETLYDDQFQESGKTYWGEPDFTLQAPLYATLFELPYTSKFQDEQRYLILLERRRHFEDAFSMIVSQSISGDYLQFGQFTGFSQYIKLEATYEITGEIDDSTEGLRFSCPSGVLDLVLDSLSRANLFIFPRIIILGDEVLAFQTITSVGGGIYRLNGIVRGVFGTSISSHTANSFGWIAIIDPENEGNIIKVDFSTFYWKALYQFGYDTIDASLVTAISRTYTGASKKPRNPGRIVATRSGSNISVQIWPSTPGVNGAGNDLVEVTDKAPPFDFVGDFRITYDAVNEIKTTDSFSFTRAGAFNLTIKSRLNGYESTGKTISVGANDGEYVV